MKKYFEFLDALRKSGSINMFGAGTPLAGRFGLSKEEARSIVSKWMETFDDSKTVDERVAEAEKV